MKITRIELLDMGACINGVRRFARQTDYSDAPIEVASLVGGDNLNSDFIWFLNKMYGSEIIVKLACEITLLAVDLVKSQIGDYELVLNWLNDPVVEGIDYVRAAIPSSPDKLKAKSPTCYVIEALHSSIDAVKTHVDGNDGTDDYVDDAIDAIVHAGYEEQVDEIFKRYLT